MVQPQERVGDLSVSLLYLIASLDAKIRFEHLNDRKIRGHRTVGEPTTGKHTPAIHMEGLEDLPDEAGLTGAGLPDDPDYLTTPPHA